MADHSRDGRRYRGGACLGSRLGDRAAGHLGARGGIKGFFCAMQESGSGTKRPQPCMHPGVEIASAY